TTFNTRETTKFFVFKFLYPFIFHFLAPLLRAFYQYFYINASFRRGLIYDVITLIDCWGTGMLKIWGRRNSFNVQKVMWLVGELALSHEHIPAGGKFGGLDTP
ncbi:MAG: hypothetical protein P1U61_02420, partial [Legionellaceae bacterium]|nr:hypothetical protein [Legionellaceae bacterium]